MKRISAEPLKSWFGFTRRERRSSFILLMLILSIAGARFIIPENNMLVELIPLQEIRVFSDSAQQRIPGTVKSVKQASGGNEQQFKKLELNASDSASLEALPGIGPVLSARIIKYRNLLGGYFSVDQIREVYGLSEETFNLISGMVITDTLLIRKIDMNGADYKEIIRLPYFERYEVTSILKYRELNGRMTGIRELVENKIIPSEKVYKIRPYLEFK